MNGDDTTAASLTQRGAEQTVLRFAEAREDDLLQFARDLVATPSPTPPGDERAVVQRICG